ncbi:carboxypeptidase-like regulatory domain-containing protein [Haliangium ochraceum]|uniref:PKD domain containing protein n=1 Tax=Haliangium ochraceum (strain DSM 14365 / JCM 11303 / SMP-2) TaxID=502025 RepID=D0LR69_HALO1|nr:carboxypeptidase-like regulatory domain-containing protein [Haliangium ochraceum]ACY15577.1 PKD domain containing protein [Haliangium ochraceum DSM 14365]
MSTTRSIRYLALALLVSVPAGCSTPRDSGDDGDSDGVELADKRGTEASKRGQEVHGTIIADLPAIDGSQNGPLVPVPDVRVWVKNVSSGVQSDPVESDLAGRYIIPRQYEGDYLLCWDKDGWEAACTREPFRLSKTTYFPGLTKIAPERDDGSSDTGVIRGRVQLADETSCWYESEFFAREETARVELLNIFGQVVQDIRANDHGDFVLTHVPYSYFQVRSTCGEEVRRAGLSYSGVDMSGATPIAAQELPNRRPSVHTAVAYADGEGVRHVRAGEIVEVVAEASDPDGDDLRFEWKVQEGSGELSSSSSDAVGWRLPEAPGLHSLYVVASDDRGGVHQHKITLEVESREVLFSGKVLGSDGAELAGAVVTVNGRTAEAGQGGAFALSLERSDSYTLHIEAEGYAELGKRVDLALSGNRWVLTRAHRQTIDPTIENVIIDKRKDWLNPRDDKEYRRRPARVTLPADALVDAEGRRADPANGPYSAYIATIDPTGEMMAGDFGARNLDGESPYLVSFGALFIEVRDAAGRTYNLAEGERALLESPIQDPLLQEDVPSEIDMWTFDPDSGDWLQDEINARRDGDVYVTELASFSTHNADLQKTDPACVRVVASPALLALGDLVARIDVATGPSSTRRYAVNIDDQNNVLYNLPDNAPFTLELFQGVAPNDVLIHAEPGNTGSPWSATAGAPPYPYSACDATVTLDVPALPPAFLQYSKGTGSAAQAAGYYAAIDPLDERTTLGDWWAINGFDPSTGAGGVRASFGNDNDLGFGRDMHCLSSGADVACFVTNYGQPDQDPGNADQALLADTTQAVATVTMEYSAVPGYSSSDRIVKFYVYQGGGPSGVRLDSADLDKTGPKFVPNLCLVCHGGNYNPVDPANPSFSEINAGASFREFDTHSFTYPGASPQADQEDEFYDLNQLVLLSNPAPAIVELVGQFYANGQTVDANAVPADWQAAQTSGSNLPAGLYLDVVGKSCRTCHVAQPDYNPLALNNSAYPDWNSYSMFRDVRQFSHFLVCDAKIMPNALVTFKNFWLSLGPHRPERFADFVDPASGWPSSLSNDIGPCAP